MFRMTVPDMTDGSASSCPTYSFACEEDSCVSISTVCDTKWDCPNGEDEMGCTYRNCTDNQWCCDNGACIDINKLCDLHDDCSDGSDERSCIVCNTNATFQCYDGSCIPISQLCDGTNDCPGLLHEDESDCVSENIALCRDWRLLGYEENTNYYINPQGSGK